MFNKKVLVVGPISVPGGNVKSLNQAVYDNEVRDNIPYQQVRIMYAINFL